MSLTEFLAKYGDKKRFCERLNITTCTLWYWLTGKHRIPIKRCIEIYSVTGKQVTLESMRPDVNWEYLLQNRQAAYDEDHA